MVLTDNFGLKNLTFTNKEGKTLYFYEIINHKKIVSVKISYSSKVRYEKKAGWKGYLGFKNKKRQIEDLEIKDPEGIFLHCNKKTGVAILRFWNEGQFNKVKKLDYDKNALKKECLETIICPFLLTFPIGNLREIDWA